MLKYGAETWIIQEKKIKLNAAEIDFRRRSARKSRLERNRNSEIRRIIEVEESITAVIEKRQLKWFGYL